MKANEKEIQIAESLRLVREGDQQAFSDLMMAYEPLIRAEVARYTVNVDSSYVEDFRQVALLAFYRAALNFHLSQHEVEFGLFAKICISNALGSQVRAYLRRNGDVSLETELVGVGDGGEGDPARRIIEEEAVQELHALIRQTLSPFENRVWNLRMAGFSAKKIGGLLGKETHSIENAVYRIRQKLRRALEK